MAAAAESGTATGCPFGVGEYGQPVELDIKEAAAEGMGPHGLCIGATGSGKSEFLRTLVLGLLATHSSTALNMILVDFKGGATFLGLDKAPHVAAAITNLAGDLTLVDRMKDAIAGEVSRRQEVLAKGNYKNVWDYESARENGADLDPLPALFICIDEFSEMLTAKPDFIDIFLADRPRRPVAADAHAAGLAAPGGGQAARPGHVPVLPDRPEDLLRRRVPRGDRRAGRVRAAADPGLGLPGRAGRADDAVQGRLRVRPVPARPACRPPARPRPPASAATAGRSSSCRTSWRSPRSRRSRARRSGEKPKDDKIEPTELEVIVGRLNGQGPPAHEVWLPPLNEPQSLDMLLPPLPPTEDRGLSPAGFFGNGRLQIPLGLVDKPFEQRRDLLWADFSGAAGHGAVVGGPQSGKSMLLRTLIMSMALTHTAGGGAVLLPRPRWRHAVDAGDAAARRWRRRPAGPGQGPPDGGRADHAGGRAGAAVPGPRASTR